MSNGISRNRRLTQSLAVAILLAGTATPALAADSGASTTTDAAPTPEDAHQDIVVTARPLFPDVQPERNLDPTGIESYGVSTVDELLGEIQSELGDDEEPLILINGERLNDIDDIGAYPIEALKNLQVFPRGSAVRMGGTSGQRVISLTLNRNLRNATITVAPKYATDGDWHSVRGEGILTHVRGSTRANLAIRIRDDSALFESERGILQPVPFRPYSLTGNVVGFPNAFGEIDPALSALAGEVVTVAPVRPGATPSLSDFAGNANAAAVTDVAPFRTLRPNSDNYDVNGSVTTRLASWLSTTATVRLNQSESHYLRGLPNAVFLLSPTNPASPFGRDVGLALYGADPLRYLARHQSAEANVSFNMQLGEWTGSIKAKHSEISDRSVSNRQSSFGAIPLGDDIDPFTTDLTALIPIRTDRTLARSTVDLAEFSFTGPAATLPAGPLQATIDGRVAWNRLRSRSMFSAFFGNGNFRRDEQAIRGAVDVPLTSRANKVLAMLGDTDLTAEYGRIHYSDAGHLDHYALGLNWQPIPMLRLRGAIEQTQAPPSIQLLGNPAIVTPDVRVFDPLSGETVDVSQITGGTSLLLPQKTKIQRLSAVLRLVERLNLQLSGEYTDTDTRNFVSSLPDASAAIMLAFPDRFVRDAEGNLTTVDLRPVNFASDHEKRLRWGFSMNAKIAGGAKPLGSAKGPAGARPPSTYLQLSANHNVVFSERIVIRPGLDPVDVLGGGAIGIGGGRLRHQLDGTAAITSGGMGARIGVTWRGPSSLESRIGNSIDTLQFSPVFLFNLRMFTDAKRILPHSSWAKGLRLSLDLVNLTNDRQRVRDSFGSTPLQYQPAYRDPIGRTVEIEIRKVF